MPILETVKTERDVDELAYQLKKRLKQIAPIGLHVTWGDETVGSQAQPKMEIRFTFEKDGFAISGSTYGEPELLATILKNIFGTKC